MAAGRSMITGAALTISLLCTLAIPALPQSTTEWRLPPRRERLLPGSVDGWEPALATGPDGEVYVLAARRRGNHESQVNQRLVL